MVNRKLTEVNLTAFVNRLFHEDFSPLLGTNLVETRPCLCQFGGLVINTQARCQRSKVLVQNKSTLNRVFPQIWPITLQLSAI